jgi:hypothetical protein
MDDDTLRAMRQYRGWTVEEIVELEGGATALRIRSPDGTRTALVTPQSALFGLEDDDDDEDEEDERS